MSHATDIQYHPDPAQYKGSSYYDNKEPTSTHATPQPSTPPLEKSEQVSRHGPLRFWRWESLALFVAIGLVVAVVVIPAHFDGTTEPEWLNGLNLNTLVALLTTFMRAAMLVVVAEVISQMKWTSFDRPRPLSDIRYYDHASRGVFGAFQLLWGSPTTALGVIGALITILSLAVGPFTQQAIKSVPCTRKLTNTSATLPIAQQIRGLGSYNKAGAGLFEVKYDMNGAMANGLVNPTGNDIAITARCETGNCDFPVSGDGITHSSMAMCSACIDTSPLITVSINNTRNGARNHTLPNGQWLAISPVDLDFLRSNTGSLEWARTEFTPEFAELVGIGVSNLTVLSFTGTACENTSKSGQADCPFMQNLNATKSIATSCTLYPCLKNYYAKVESGTLDERLVSTQPAPLNLVERPGQSSNNASYTALKLPCAVNDREYSMSDFSQGPLDIDSELVGINIDGTNYTVPDACLYKLYWAYGRAFEISMGQLLTGKCQVSTATNLRVYCSESWWLAPLYKEGAASFESISESMDHVTTAITNTFRRVESEHNSPEAPMSGRQVTGFVYAHQVCTSFDWRWVLFPIILVSATFVLLVGAIVHGYSHRSDPIWKSSVLPLLFYGFRSTENDRLPVMDLTQLDKHADGVTARFQRGENTRYMEVMKSG